MTERLRLWTLLDQMAHNSGPVAKTKKLYKNETIGSKISEETIQVKARTRKQETWIKKFLQDVGYTKSALESIVEDLVVFGNAIDINSLDPVKGITEITSADPFSLQERVEFNPVRIKHQSEGNFYGYTNLSTSDPRMVQFVKAVKDPNMATSEYFKSTLMGFKIDDFEFAPWQVAHFRMPSSRHEFAPYGKPLFLDALSPYMTWKATDDLIGLARVASFPKEIITLHGAENIAPEMMFRKLQELKEIEENLSEGSAQDTVGVGQKIYTIDGVYSYNVKTTNMDLSSMGDLTAAEENVISSLDVPIAYLIQGKDKGFGESNKTLVAQSKVFAKAVYSIQSVILETLITQIKIQMILTGEYDPEKDYFELSMPLPTVDDDPELVRLFQEKLRLAKDTAETIRDLLGMPADTQLPTDTIKSIMTGLSAAPAGELDMWISTIANNSIVPVDKPDDDASTDKSRHDDSYVPEPLTESQKKIVRTKLTEDLIKEAVMKVREDSQVREGAEYNRHFMASNNISNTNKRIIEDIEVKHKLLKPKLKEDTQLKNKATRDLYTEVYCSKPILSKESSERYTSTYKASN